MVHDYLRLGLRSLKKAQIETTRLNMFGSILL